MKEVVEQHLRCTLESYYTATKTQWPQATQMMLSKRKYLFEGIKKKAQGMRGGILSWEQKLISVASDVDCELRRTKTGLTKYYHQQKAMDPTKVARRNPATLLHNPQI